MPFPETHFRDSANPDALDNPNVTKEEFELRRRLQLIISNWHADISEQITDVIESAIRTEMKRLRQKPLNLAPLAGKVDRLAAEVRSIHVHLKRLTRWQRLVQWWKRLPRD